MNNQRRKEINKLMDGLAELAERLGSIREEEEEYLENMPESFRDGEKGQRTEEVISSLQYAEEAFEEITTNLDEAIQ